ncbi:MAG: hypothetical protein CM15mP117_11670 [Alphaproteobacteria bacterium]|nr:MAG: hypothetical protein CM15mP117_11670 [Alphaproteobacteria bacterium]
MNLGKLLILDDDEILLRRLSKSMESFGFEVTAVSSIEEAEEIIEKIIFDTAVLDLKLADGSGLSIVKNSHLATPMQGDNAYWIWKHCNSGSGYESRGDRLSSKTGKC